METEVDVSYVMVDPREIETAPPFDKMFPIDGALLQSIIASMKDDGFDPAKGLIVWKERNLLLDGHTRRHAAIKVGIRDVPVFYHSFESEDEAYDYAVDCQVQRRQLTDAEIHRIRMERSSRRPHGYRPGNQYGPSNNDDGPRGPSSLQQIPESTKETAAKLKTSVNKIKFSKQIEDNKDEFPGINQDVLDGKIALRTAVKHIAARKRKDNSTRVYPMPQTDKEAVRKCDSSAIQLTDDDREWLGGFKIRGEVVAHRFDEDAMLYRAISASLHQIRLAMANIVGVRSVAEQSPLFRAAKKLCGVPPITLWERCLECRGIGVTIGVSGGVCKVCKGSGYTIPGI